MTVMPFSGRQGAIEALPGGISLIDGASLEVTPRTAAKIADFCTLLPSSTRLYVAHIEGTPIDDMVATCRRLTDEGFTVMPHLPARLIRDAGQLDTWLDRYASEAGVSEALVIAGGARTAQGDFHSSMQLLETGACDRHGFGRLHVAGHPEGNRDIDPDGSTRLVDEAARWKQDFSERTDARMALVTQFAFDARPVLDWSDRLDAAGVTLPIHVGLAGPSKLQTLMKFAMACGVGPSVDVLKRRARDITKLVRPFEPTEVLSDLSSRWIVGRAGRIEGVHFFPLGGIAATVDYMRRFAMPEARVGAR